MGLADCRSHKYGDEPAAAFVVRPAKDTAFALFDGQATLFCESTQQLYALNSIAALIWCCLDENGGPQAALARLIDGGADRKTATQHVDDAIRGWLQLGLLRADFHPSRQRHACSFRIDSSSYSIETPSRDLSHQIAAFFDPHPAYVDAGTAMHFQVIEIDRSLHIFFEDRRIDVCGPDELLPTIKALVTAQVLVREREEIAFHAACMSQRGRTLLLSGVPGAGKTTLALQLAAKGFGYGGDDIALISPDGLVKGLPFAATVKSGAWDIVSRTRPDLPNAPVHWRPDGQLVRYLKIEEVDHESHPVGWIVFLRRQSDASLEFVDLDGVEAMRRVIEGAYSPVHRLSLAGFGALRRMLTDVKTVELIYECSAEAADAIFDLCNGVCNDGA